MTVETKWVSALVPAELADDFKAVADSHDRSVSAELRRAMKRHIEADEKEQEEAVA